MISKKDPLVEMFDVLNNLVWYFAQKKLDNIMPLPSRRQSTVCSWREFELTNKSAEWNVVLEGFKQP